MINFINNKIEQCDNCKNFVASTETNIMYHGYDPEIINVITRCVHYEICNDLINRIKMEGTDE